MEKTYDSFITPYNVTLQTKLIEASKNCLNIPNKEEVESIAMESNTPDHSRNSLVNKNSKIKGKTKKVIQLKQSSNSSQLITLNVEMSSTELPLATNDMSMENTIPINDSIFGMNGQDINMTQFENSLKRPLSDMMKIEPPLKQQHHIPKFVKDELAWVQCTLSFNDPRRHIYFKLNASSKVSKRLSINILNQKMTFWPAIIRHVDTTQHFSILHSSPVCISVQETKITQSVPNVIDQLTDPSIKIAYHV